MNKQQINHVCILDRSNTAHHDKVSLIDAYYDSVDHLRTLARMNTDQDHRITLVTMQKNAVCIPFFAISVFDDRVYQSIEPVASGGTPLYDCLAQTIGMIRVADRLTTTDKAYRFTLFTNGRDTASTKYTAEGISLLLNSLPNPKWAFTMIGYSSFTSTYAEQMGIRQVCVLNNKRKNSVLALHLSHLLRQKGFQIQAA